VANDQLAAFIDRHTAAWNRHDATALCNNHSERGVVVSPMFARIEGRAQICASYAALFAAFPDWQLRFGVPIREGARIAIPFSVTATHRGEFMGLPGTGRRCEFEGVSLYEIDDDLLIREERRVYDFTGLLTRLGVLKVKPAM
jgi:steroid delta-isomerase-like uncharacterized protein